jgi:hypothetical protein
VGTTPRAENQPASPPSTIVALRERAAAAIVAKRERGAEAGGRVDGQQALLLSPNFGTSGCCQDLLTLLFFRFSAPDLLMRCFL